MKYFLPLVLSSVLCTPAFSQRAPRIEGKSDWSIDKPYAQKAFIENKGQFDGQDGLQGSAIRFSIANDGVEIFFTPGGLTYKHREMYVEPKDPDEKEPTTARGLRKEMEREKPEITDHFVHLEWLGANKDVTIRCEDPVTNYYTYGDPKDKSGKTCIKAFAYKKITYINLYPGIDVQYTVPENKSGVKYAVILHPGADVSLVKMKYSGEESVSLDTDKNTVIKSSMGDIIDHAPVTVYAGQGSSIPSSFVINKDVVGFSLHKYDHSRTVIIDPWSSVPVYTGYNGSYECCYDYNGNVYVYGGTFPWQELKYNSAGALQWTYTANPFNPGWGYYFGDFTVDATSGSSYLIESINTGIGSEIIKVNNAGTQLIVFPGNVNLEEGWRIAINQCQHNIVIAGGGVSYYNQGAVIDTNLTSLTAVNVINFNEIAHDMCLLALDKSGFAYLATTNWGNANYNNRLMKANQATLAPTVFMVADGYTFQEGGNLTYISGGANQSNGYNGIAVSPNFLYTCDGATLKKWDKNTGALLQSAVIAGTPRTCGGLEVTDCDDIFIGVQSAVNKYDVNLNMVSTTPTTNIVYDLKVYNNKLYASGKQFVQELSITNNCTSSMTLNVTSSGSSCSSNSGTATANPTGGVGPYTYTWSNGQTTQTATGLASGTYTVTVTDNSCPPITTTATVVVTNSGSLAVTAAQTNVQCATSTNGTASVTVTGGQSPYTYSWTPSGGTNSNATGLSPGTYTCYITDASGCSTQQTFTITAPPALTLSTTPTNITCNGANNGNSTSTAGGGVGPYTYSWAPSGGSNSNATGLGPGTYTLYITDANGCTMTQTAVITQPNAITATTTVTNTTCGNTNGSVTVTASGGTGNLTYSWAPSGGSNSNATGLGAGNYTCYITDANGCTQTATGNVTNSNGPSATLQSQTNLLCNGVNNGTATVSVTNGTAPYTYSWSGNGGSAQTATGLSGGTYTCYVTDANGCTTSQTVTISQPPAITAATSTTFASCGANDGTASVNAAGGTGSLTYSWAPSGGTGTTASGLAIGIYTVYVTDANGCTQTATATVTNASGPTATVGPNVTITGGTSTPLSGNGGGTYSWSPATGLSCTTCQNPVANPTVTTQYCLTVTDPSGCSDIACMTVTVDIPCPSNADFDCPNAFSPNGDGHNDYWNIQGFQTCLVDFVVIIYDRWGEKVYESKDITSNWDGTYKGKQLDPAVFVYYIKATLVSSGEEIVKRGNISLIR